MNERSKNDQSKTRASEQRGQLGEQESRTAGASDTQNEQPDRAASSQHNQTPDHTDVPTILGTTSHPDETRIEFDEQRDKTLIEKAPSDGQTVTQQNIGRSDSDETATVKIDGKSSDGPKVDETQYDTSDQNRVDAEDAPTVLSEIGTSASMSSEDSRDAPTLISEIHGTESDDSDESRNAPTLISEIEAGDSQGSDASRDAPTLISDVGSAADRAAGEVVEHASSLGHYRIERVLGEGAFGTVYLAHDPQLDRKVAIKVARTGVLVGRTDVDRFLREARSAAQLRHPHIIPVYEFGQIQGTSYIAYEFIEGMTLKDYLQQDGRDGKLPQTEAAELVSKLASALHYAHSHGIVHRDMKPENVMIDHDGEPHITDFGLARRDDGSDTRTREGILMGTAAYMSPEQATGRAHLADGRSDVWSLGVMFMEFLTGVRPFRGEVTEILVAVRQYEPKSVRQLDKSIPKDLETICKKCLAKEADERYQTAEILAEELARWSRGEPILARPIGVLPRTWRWARRNPAVSSLIGTVFLVLLTGMITSTILWNEATTAARDRAVVQVQQLATSNADQVPYLLDDLKKFRDRDPRQFRNHVMPLLSGPAESDDPADKSQVRRRLATFALSNADDLNTDVLQQLQSDLVTAGPDEFPVIRGVLEPAASRLAPGLWSIAENDPSATSRFRAACALALYDPKPARWEPILDKTVTQLFSQSAFELPIWTETLDPIRNHLQTTLEIRYLEGRDEDERIKAANVIAALFGGAEDTSFLVSLVPKSSPMQLNALLPRLQERAKSATRKLDDDLASITRATDTQDAASQTANVVTALLAISDDPEPWAWLGGRPDKSVRTDVIHRIGPAGVDMITLLNRLAEESDPHIVAAILLSLGEYPVESIDPSLQDEMLSRAETIYRDHRHSGVHSAADWLLRRFGRTPPVEELQRSTAEITITDDRDWYVNGQGQTFAVIRGPVDFRMGTTPENYIDTFSGEEAAYECRIPRTFAIATKEVTVAAYSNFCNAVGRPCEYDEDNAPDESCPIIEASWFDAICFCRWLSEQEGIPEDQMCYPPIPEIDAIHAKGLFGRAIDQALGENLLDKSGYRLPTAAEWEFACRAGANTDHLFGREPAFLDRYGWYLQNADNHVWPVGQLKPNDFGLFDVHGNAMEFCQNGFLPDPPTTDPGQPAIDGQDPRESVSRELRDGNWEADANMTRVTTRDYATPAANFRHTGFRLARTIPAEESSSD